MPQTRLERNREPEAVRGVRMDEHNGTRGGKKGATGPKLIGVVRDFSRQGVRMLRRISQS